MVLSKLVGLFVLIISLCPFGQSDSGITPASDVTVPIYQTINFTCQGNGDQQHWLLNGSLLNDYIQQQRHITIYNDTEAENTSSILSIVARPNNNRVTLGCQIVNSVSQEIKITTATLWIIGISRTTNIRLFFKARNLTWSRPTLFLPNSVWPRMLTVTYHVQINNGSIITTTNTSVILSDFLPLCSEFTVTIRACAANYCSETTKTFSGNNTINIQHMDIENNNINLTILAEYTRFCDRSVVVTVIPMQGLPINYTCVVPSIENRVTFSCQISPVRCGFFNLLVSLLNSVDEVEDTVNVKNIVAYDIKGLIVSTEGYTNGSVNVQCNYTAPSTAEGCYIEFKHVISGKTESFNIRGTDNKIISVSTSGYYTVTAYLRSCVHVLENEISVVIIVPSASRPVTSTAEPIESSNTVTMSSSPIGPDDEVTKNNIEAIVIVVCTLFVLFIVICCTILFVYLYKKRRRGTHIIVNISIRCCVIAGDIAASGTHRNPTNDTEEGNNDTMVSGTGSTSQYSDLQYQNSIQEGTNETSL